MKAFKIVVTGPRGAGKTSFIRTISETAVVSSEESDGDNGREGSATVEMDFGRISIAGDTMIYLFGTQGMERFDFMWKAISEGMLGFILLVDGSRPETFADAGRIMEYFRSRVDVPCVLGVSRVAEDNFDDVSASLREVLHLETTTPLLACETTVKDEVKQVLLELLYTVLQEVES